MKKVLDRSNTPRTINLHEGSNRRGSNSQQHERRQSHHHILGPLTYEAHERYQNRIDATNTAPSKNSKTSVPTTSTDKEAGYSESSHPTVVEVIMAVAAAAFFVALAIVVTLPSALLAFLLIQSFILHWQDIWDYVYIYSIYSALFAFLIIQSLIQCLGKATVDATHINKTDGTAFSSAAEDYTSVLSATIKYAKMSLWPFALFVPSFFLFSHLIIGMAYSGNNGQSNQPQPRRKQVSWKTLGMTTIFFLSLFAFMEAMLAMADAGKWILLVMTSSFPLLMMVLARLSLVSATAKYDVITTTCGNNDTTVAVATAAALNSVESSVTATVASAIVLLAFFAVMATSCTFAEHKLARKLRSQKHPSILQRIFAALSISQAIALAKMSYTGPHPILQFLSETFGYIFIFLPFTAGMLHHLLEPLYILSVPLSSLALCTIAGMSPISLIGLFMSIVILLFGMAIFYMTVVMSFHIYSWLIHRQFLSTLLFMMLASLATFGGILTECINTNS